MKFKKSQYITFLLSWLTISVGLYFFTHQSINTQTEAEGYKQYISQEINVTEYTSIKDENDEEDIAVEVLRHIDASKIQEFIAKNLFRKDK